MNKFLIALGVILLVNQVCAIDLGRIKMYKQLDQDYNEKLKNNQNSDTSNFQNDDNLSDEDDQNISKNINFPKVFYTYKDIASTLIGKVSSITEKQKVFEGLHSLIEQEQEFQNALEQIKLKHNEMLLKSFQIQEDVGLHLEQQSMKAQKKFVKLSKNLDTIKGNSSNSNSAQERIYDLEDLQRNLEKVHKNVIESKQQQSESKKILRQLQGDLKEMYTRFGQASKVNSLTEVSKIFSDNLKKTAVRNYKQ